MNNILPITYFVRTSITGSQSGLQERNMASVLFLTTETPSNSDEFRVYRNASSVASDYGTNSDTYKYANALFNQTPNILSANGKLVIAPLNNSVSATQGTLTTANISANLNNIIAVTDGEFRITTNGTSYNITNLNFTSATTLADVVKIMNQKINQVLIETTTNGFKMTSKAFGDTSEVALSSVPSGTGTDLTGATLFNIATATDTTGVNSTGETIQDAILRLQDKIDFVPIVSNLKMEQDLIVPLASFINGRDNMYIETFSNVESLDEEILDIAEQKLNKFRCLFYCKSTEDAELFKFGYTGFGFSVNTNAQNSAMTMNLKDLVGVPVDGDLTESLIDKSIVCGADVFGAFGGVNKIMSNGANGFFDDVFNTLYIKLGVDVTLFNALARTSSKIPQTEQGMIVLKTALDSFFNKCVFNGIIGLGLKWNSSETFGNPETFRENITQSGYYIYSLPVSQQSQIQREERIAPVIQTALKFSGAIHSVDVIVNIEK